MQKNCKYCNHEAYGQNSQSEPCCAARLKWGECDRGTPMRKDATMQGRNDICACGSGKKFKHCCINETPARRTVFAAHSSIPAQFNEQIVPDLREKGIALEEAGQFTEEDVKKLQSNADRYNLQKSAMMEAAGKASNVTLGPQSKEV